MEIIYNKVFLEHDTGMHPENRKRLESLGKIPETEIENGEKYLELFHTKEYIRRIKEACEKGKILDPETILSKKTYDAAVHAVGATVMASETKGFAAVRPPGHHAHPSKSSGFCIFNSISIAVQKLLSQKKRVLIFDFDSHLGDGTEAFFYSSDKVMYWSIHQSDTFPGGGSVDEIGKGKGRGYTINVPLPKGSGDDVYKKAIDAILPVAKKFNPDIVAVSAGFDGHEKDQLLDLRLSANTYYMLGKMLRDNFSDVFATLEGGYNTEVLPVCLFDFLDGINGKKMRFKEDATDSMIQVVDEFGFRLDKLEKNLSGCWRL